jgi:hypothetical protein
MSIEYSDCVRCNHFFTVFLLGLPNEGSNQAHSKAFGCPYANFYKKVFGHRSKEDRLPCGRSNDWLHQRQIV